MTQLKNLAWSVVKIKYRVSRGQSWVIYFKDAVYVYIAVLALEDLLKRFGIVDPNLIKYLLITLVPAYFLCCYVIGWLDEHWGIWKMESVWGSKDLNPFMERLNEMVKGIHIAVVKTDNKIMKEYEKRYETDDNISEILNNKKM
jgi:hypothetical protein